MTFLLNNRNIFSYLTQLNLCQEQEQELSQVENMSCKNFNLLVRLPSDRLLLVKQEPHDRQGETKGDLWHEWKVHQLLQTYPNLQPLLKLVSEIIHFDEDHAIVVTRYLHEYCDLDDFYTQHRTFSPIIATALGHTLATVHQATFDQPKYRLFLEEDEPEDESETIALMQLETELTPEIFGQVSEEGLKFYALYQRYESLDQAIVQLQQCQELRCLIHHDLKFNNILLHQDWERCEADANASSFSRIRLIDWEKWAWGDPASDLGMLIAEYLKIWLKSLGLRSGVEINLALQWAAIPLEELQPSIAALVQAYLAAFPEVLFQFPQFLPRTMQFTGLALIESLRAKLYYREPFGNTEIGMLQVAKTLLCAPEQSILTVFGMPTAELINYSEGESTGKTIWHSPLPSSFQPTMRSRIVQQIRDRASVQLPISSSLLPATCTQEQMLQDLVQQIQIRSDSAYHPHYALPLAEQLQSDRLQQLPTEVRQQYVRVQLRNLLYDLYFSGELRMTGGQEDFASTGAIENTIKKNIENNAVGGLNVEFFDQIQRSNNGTGYWDGGWQVCQQINGRYAVQKEELTIFIEPHLHLREERRSPHIGDLVEILLPNHRMSGNFYVAVGNAGTASDDRPTLEICFHVSPIGALALMRHLTVELNRQHIPFSLKMISDGEEDGRYDAATLYLERHFYVVLRPILKIFYTENRSHFYSAVPLMMKPIAPGIGLAEEPEEETFGIHRCQIIADALLEIEEQQINQPQNIAERRLAAIAQRFLEQGINWRYPYLNGKADCYEPIDV